MFAYRGNHMHDSDSTSSAHVSAWGPHAKPSQQTKHLRHGALAPSGEGDNDAIHMNRTLSDWTTTASQKTTILSEHAGGDLIYTFLCRLQ